MTRGRGRNVKRSSGRQDIVRRYNTRAWYELPDWAVIWFSHNFGWVILVYLILLAPPTLLAIVVGAHSIPFLAFLGVPGNGNGVGLAALVLVVNFILLALAVRPLLDQREKGWKLTIAAALVHLVHSYLLGHAISALLELIAIIYIYGQIRHRLSA